MKPFQEALEAYASTGERAELPDFAAFVAGLEAHFAGWQASLQSMPEEMRRQLGEIEERVGQGYSDCLEGAGDLSRAPEPRLAEAFLRLHRQHTQNLYLFQEEVWKLHGPTPLPGINQIFWSYEAWLGGQATQDYYWHCLEAERKRLTYALETPGMELELQALARRLYESLGQLLRLPAGQETEACLDEIQRLAHGYAERLGPDSSANWLAHLELLLDSEDEQELHAFVWRKLSELHTLSRGVGALLQSLDSAVLEEKGRELAELLEEMTEALQDLLEKPDTPLEEIREIDEDLSAVRQEMLSMLDARGQLACPKCAATVESGKKFCGACGFRMLEKVDEREGQDLSGSATAGPANPNLAYLQAVSQDYLDGKLERTDMEAELDRWRRLLGQLPGHQRLETQLESLDQAVLRLEAWMEAPTMASLSDILEEMERALTEVAGAEAK
ncbi:MAG: zinc ribbon domain-containing protein [Vulcanimicrobiota bacterium]